MGRCEAASLHGISRNLAGESRGRPVSVHSPAVWARKSGRKSVVPMIVALRPLLSSVRLETFCVRSSRRLLRLRRFPPSSRLPSVFSSVWTLPKTRSLKLSEITSYEGMMVMASNDISNRFCNHVHV